MGQTLDLTDRLQVAENQAQYLVGQVQGLQINYHELQNVRTVDLQRQEMADQRTQYLEDELRASKRRINLMNYAYTTSMERV